VSAPRLRQQGLSAVGEVGARPHHHQSCLDISVPRTGPGREAVSRRQARRERASRGQEKYADLSSRPRRGRRTPSGEHGVGARLSSTSSSQGRDLAVDDGADVGGAVGQVLTSLAAVIVLRTTSGCQPAAGGGSATETGSADSLADPFVSHLPVRWGGRRERGGKCGFGRGLSEPAGPGALRSGCVGGVEQRASGQGQAPAAQALVERVLQGLELTNPGRDQLSPRPCQTAPVLLIRRAVSRQLGEEVLELL